MHSITLESIISEIRKANPYQKKQIAENFRGQKINWELKYGSVTELAKRGFVRIGLADHAGNTAFCEIETGNFPLIKILPKDAPVRVMGVIGSADGLCVDIENAHIAPVRDEKGQIYFPYGSRDDLLLFLASEVRGAKDVKIIDPYMDIDILTLLEEAKSNSEISLIGGNTISNDFIERAKAFKTYFSPRILSLKKSSVAHARFWIIDGRVYHVDSSLKNGGGNKVTMVHLIEDTESEKIKRDFEIWWSEADIIF